MLPDAHVVGAVVDDDRAGGGIEDARNHLPGEQLGCLRGADARVVFDEDYKLVAVQAGHGVL